MATARVVKAESIRDLSARPAFNFVDLSHEADKVIAQARQTADELLSQARRNVDGLYAQEG